MSHRLKVKNLARNRGFSNRHPSRPIGVAPLAWGCWLVLAGCATTTTAGPAPQPTEPEIAKEIDLAEDSDETSAEPPPFNDVLAPCLPEGEPNLLALETALDRAYDSKDARCWTSAEIALAHLLLQRSADLAEDARIMQRRLAAYRFRQAELRASRYAFDDLAAIAQHGRARVEARKMHREAMLDHLSEASRSVALHTAATGKAPQALDRILLERMIELLAAWERQGQHTHVADAFETSSHLKAREALRSFTQAGTERVTLAEAAVGDAARALATLDELSARTRDSFGKENRIVSEDRVVAAEVILDNGAAWSAAAPLLLGWLPGTMPDILLGVQTVLGPGEVFLDYTVGEEHSIIMALSETSFKASPIAGREELETAVASCLEKFCDRLDRELLKPVADLLDGARQVLVAAHGPLHKAPLESRIDARVVRVPSAQGLSSLRLRAWGNGPRERPVAARLVPGAHGPLDDPEAEHADLRSVAPGDPVPVIAAPAAASALAPLWATLASGHYLVDWKMPGEALRWYGAPLTVPAAAAGSEPVPIEDPSAPLLDGGGDRPEAEESPEASSDIDGGREEQRRPRR